VKAETKTAIRFLALVSFLAFFQLALGGALMSVVAWRLVRQKYAKDAPQP
jgi:hypothetical protein